MTLQARIEAAIDAYTSNSEFPLDSNGLLEAIEAADNEPEYKAAIENAIKTMEWATITLGSERPSYEAMQAAIKLLRGET